MHKPMPRTLAAVRATFNTYLDNAGSVIVQTRTPVSDGAGGWSDTITAIGTVDAWIQPMNVRSQIEIAGGAIGERQMHTLVAGTTVPLALGYQVVYSGGTYEIIDMSHTTVIEWASFQKATIAKVV